MRANNKLKRIIARIAEGIRGRTERHNLTISRRKVQAHLHRLCLLCLINGIQLLLKHLLILWDQKVTQRLFEHIRGLTAKQTRHTLVNKGDGAILVMPGDKLSIGAVDQIIWSACHLDASDGNQMEVGARCWIAMLVNAMVHARLLLWIRLVLVVG